MKNENMPLGAEEQEQKEQTRVMPPVDASARSPRRRRSERYEQEEPTAPQPEASAVALDAPGESEPASLRRETRVLPAQEAASRPMPPRPNVLNRAEQAAAQSTSNEDGVAARRPMGTPPGFAPRRPVAANQSEQPRSAARVRHTPVSGPGRTTPASGQARKPAALYHDQAAAGRGRSKGRWLLIALVILLLVIGLVMVGIMLLGQNNDGPIGQVRNVVTGLLPGEEKEPAAAVTASGFTAANNRGTAPLMVMFNLTTSKSVEQVRLVDEDGIPLDATSAAVTENADSIIWVMNLSVDSGFEGLVLAQMYDGAEWVDTGMSQALEIAMPAAVSTIDVAAFSETTDEPVSEPIPPYEEETEEPAFFPEEDPEDDPDADEPETSTPTPTLAVSATPTAAAAGTPTPPPASLAMTQAPISGTPEPEEEDLTGGANPADEMPEEDEEEPEETVTAAPTATPPLTGAAVSKADPSLIRDTVIYNGNSKVDSYKRERTLNMPIADAYITQPYGVMTYRGNAFRQNASVGTVSDISGMSLLWTAEAGSVKGSSSTYYGIGWTGQPVIIKWSKEVRAATNIVAEKKDTTALKEVIVAGMDGNIYFLDLADGQPTRSAINLGYPMRGTPSLHPLGYPIMTVGQYARKMASGTGSIGLRFYNLLNQKQDYIIDGLDAKSKRPYYEVGAFDTSALIDPNSDTLVAIGTNGMLYTVSLKTEYSVAEEKISINPSTVSMKSRVKGQASKNVAVQSSPAMYGSYVYYADMQGILRCVDTTTMTTVWAVETGDAVEAAIALDMDENGGLWLYTANTLENRSKGDCVIRRYNALTGEADWTYAVNLTKNKKHTSGAMASPVIGQNGLADLVYYTISDVSVKGAAELFGEGASSAAGVLVAVNKETGRLAWAHALDAYSYSSPVAVYSAEGNGWIIQASSSGTLTLLDGLTGQVVSTLKVEGAIDASPAVYNDILVIGTTGKNTTYIYGIQLQ